LSLSDVAEQVRRGEAFLVVPHLRPDVDALGSSLGLAAVLRALGKQASVFVPGKLPRSVAFLVSGASITTSVPAGVRFDATFVLDTATPDLVPAGLPEVDRRGPLIVLDHHAVHDDFGDLVVRDDAASATAELVVALARELGLSSLPAACATPLYAALAADTGGFRYPSTSASTLRLGAELLDAGAEAWPVAQQLFEVWPMPRLRLLAALIDGLETDFDGRLAWLRVSRALMREVGVDDDQVDGLVNYGRMLEGVEVSVLLWEWPAEAGAQATKLSLRSNGEVDVAQLARVFGGGGHRAAAGALAPLSMERTAARLRAELELVFRVSGP